MNRPRSRAGEIGADRLAARSTAAARLVVLLAVAVGGSFAGTDDTQVDTFFVLAALVGVPWATLLLFISEGHGRTPLLARMAWIGDLVSILGYGLLVPQQQRTALLLSLTVVAISCYVVRSVPGWVIAVTAVMLTSLGQLVVADSEHVRASELLLYGVVLGAVTLLMGRIGGQQRWAAARAQQLEGRAGTILDAVADAIILTDLQGHVRQLNPAAKRLVHAEDGVGAGCAELLQLHNGERPLDCREGCALLALSGAPDGVRLWRPRPDGTRQPVLATAAVAGGPLTGEEVVHSLRDITRLMEAEEAKTLFLATTSHELKTPLTVIRGFADSLLRRPDSPPELVAVALDAISRRSIELSKIVDRLLMSSRIEAGQLSVSLEAVDVSPLVVERATAMGGSTGRAIEVDVAALPQALANNDALATVVDHLLDNAIKYTSAQAAICVHAAADCAKGRVVLRIRDDGVGMDEEQVEHCFEKFWQAETGSARRFGGTGIGLYIVRSLVEAMGGTVVVRSELGVGTEFTIELPFAPSPHVDLPTPRAAEQTSTGEPSMIREFMRQIGVTTGADG